MLDMTIKEAPDFGPGYPNSGERIGPAWRWIWTALGDGDWHRGMTLAEQGSWNWDVSPKTISNLLWQAERRRLVEKQLRSAPATDDRRPRPKQAWYRRADLVG